MSVYVPVELRRSIRRQFSNRCAYCQTAEELTPVTFEIDHIEPLSLGGETVKQNLCLACPTCNRFKSDRTYAADRESRDVTRLFHPQNDNWAEHFRWNDDATDASPPSPATLSRADPPQTAFGEGEVGGDQREVLN